MRFQGVGRKGFGFPRGEPASYRRGRHREHSMGVFLCHVAMFSVEEFQTSGVSLRRILIGTDQEPFVNGAAWKLRAERVRPAGGAFFLLTPGRGPHTFIICSIFLQSRWWRSASSGPRRPFCDTSVAIWLPGTRTQDEDHPSLLPGEQRACGFLGENLGLPSEVDISKQ